MTTFTAKHYIKIAELIGSNMMDDDVVEAFSEMFKSDSSMFKPELFLRAVQRAASGYDIWDEIELVNKRLEKISDELTEEERRLINIDEPTYAAMRCTWRKEISKASKILGELVGED